MSKARVVLLSGHLVVIPQCPAREFHKKKLWRMPTPFCMDCTTSLPGSHCNKNSRITMFELARKEPDGSTTTIKIFRDEDLAEAYIYAESLERRKAILAFRDKARRAGLEHKLNALIKASGIHEANTEEDMLAVVGNIKAIAHSDEDLNALMLDAVCAYKLAVIDQYVLQRIG